jgi:hypothetical protein
MVSLTKSFGTLLSMRRCTTSYKMNPVAVLTIAALLFSSMTRQSSSNYMFKIQFGNLVAIMLVKFSRKT